MEIAIRDALTPQEVVWTQLEDRDTRVGVVVGQALEPDHTHAAQELGRKAAVSKLRDMRYQVEVRIEPAQEDIWDTSKRRFLARDA